MMRLLRVQLWLLFCITLLISHHPVTAIMQTAQLDVYLGGIADATSVSTPSYTFLASQAFFGTYPQMLNINNPVQNLALPPSDNPLLCHNVTQDAIAASLYKTNTLL